jgi:DNA polymerase-3 subunit epsilon
MSASERRIVALDTETTGTSNEDKIVEIACIEVIDGVIGKSWQTLINPKREISAGALRVHGLTNEFLEGQPTFDEVVDDLNLFINESMILAHNISFDMRMLNNEYIALGMEPLRNQTLCTLAAARKALRGEGIRFSLDSLCDHFEIDRTERVIHGALVDTNLLVQVYIKMSAAGHI